MQIIKTKDDFYTSVERAFDEIDGNWRNYQGVVVFGSHAPENVEEKIKLIKEAREKKIPFLGICFGLQLAVIEFARNVIGEKTATSQEFGKGVYYVTKLPELRVGIKKVQTSLGDFYESHWHNYAVNKEYIGKLMDAGMAITEYSEDGIVERIELKNHPHFSAIQYHAEYQSSQDKPHRVLVDFLNICKNNEK